ncbi:MAG: hypothetical protein ACRDJE_27380, partial [Dehalococcoidia bacterium]
VEAGRGLTAALMCACRSDTTTSSGSSPAAATAGAVTNATQAGRGVAALLGRSATPAAGEQSVSGGVHKALFSTNPPTLDPHGTIRVFTIQGGSAAYSRLIRPKGAWDLADSLSLTTEPELALSLESPDVVTWTAKRKDLASQVYFVGAIPMGLAHTMIQPQVRNYLLGDAYGIAPVTWAQL